MNSPPQRCCCSILTVHVSDFYQFMERIDRPISTPRTRADSSESEACRGRGKNGREGTTYRNFSPISLKFGGYLERQNRLLSAKKNSILPTSGRLLGAQEYLDNSFIIEVSLVPEPDMTLLCFYFVVKHTHNKQLLLVPFQFFI